MEYVLLNLLALGVCAALAPWWRIRRVLRGAWALWCADPLPVARPGPVPAAPDPPDPDPALAGELVDDEHRLVVLEGGRA